MQTKVELTEWEISRFRDRINKLSSMMDSLSDQIIILERTMDEFCGLVEEKDRAE